MKKRSKLVLLLVAVAILATMLTGCDWAGFGSSINDLKGSIKGNTYECQFYSNSGELFMTAEGKNINMRPNIVNEYTYSGEYWERTETMSSVITITIDGKQYFCDPTFELNFDKGVGYRYFGQTYAQRIAGGLGSAGITAGRYYPYSVDESMLSSVSLAF